MHICDERYLGANAISDNLRVKQRKSKHDIEAVYQLLYCIYISQNYSAFSSCHQESRKVRKLQSYDNAAMDYTDSSRVPFHVVKGETDSRLVSASYNIRIKNDSPMSPKHRNNLSNDMSDLSSGDNSGTENSNSKSPDHQTERPTVVYATLSKRLLDALAEPEDVVQARVLKRFESENEYKPKSRHYRY